MWKLNKKGFTLVEVLISLSIFSILFAIISSVQISNMRLRNYNKKLHDYNTYMDAVKNEIAFNLTRVELQELIDCNKIYINNENINIEKIENQDIKNLFSGEIKDSKNHAYMKIISYSPIKINLILNKTILEEEVEVNRILEKE